MRCPVLLLLLMSLLPATQLAGDEDLKIVEVLEINGAIGPGVGDYLVEAIEEANQATPVPELILVTLDTPGGLVTTLRDGCGPVDSSLYPRPA